MSYKARKFNYIDGVTPAVAKRIAKMVFGSYMFQFDVDYEQANWNLTLFKGVPEANVKRLRDNFGGYKIKLISKEEIENKRFD